MIENSTVIPKERLKELEDKERRLERTPSFNTGTGKIIVRATYTAVIPTGQYANEQPSCTIEETIEHPMSREEICDVLDELNDMVYNKFLEQEKIVKDRIRNVCTK